MVDSRRLACGPPGQSRSHSWCSKRKWGDAGSLPSEAEGKMRPPDQASGEAGPGLLLAEGTRSKWENRKRNRLQGLTEGQVIGLLRSGLFKNKTTGEFPGGVLMGWGVGRGEQYWGGTLKMDIPPWFPCVKFEVDGQEYHVITGCGTFKDKWKLEQSVTILYNPENPRIAYLEGDDSYIIHHRIYFCFGVAVVLLAALAYAILIM